MAKMEAQPATPAPAGRRSVEPRVKTAALRRDIIVIGASTGGLEAFRRVLQPLPADLPAAIFVVLHTHTTGSARLPEILNGGGPFKSAYAIHGEPIEHGRVYVAPPDNHLIVDRDYVHVVRGPRENGHRPAVDPLFRSAARAYGARVIGVLLTGALDCGTAGLMVIKAQGGTVIVQDPDEALQPEMPRNALNHVDVDHVVGVARIASLLARFVRIPVRPPPAMQNGVLAEIEAATAQPAEVVCPSCGGVMTESTVNALTRFRCHTGHTFTLDGLAAEQARALEGALWAAVRALEESETLARRMASHAALDLGERFKEKAETMKRHARRIQQMLLRGQGLTVPDAAAGSAPKSKRARRATGSGKRRGARARRVRGRS